MAQSLVSFDKFKNGTLQNCHGKQKREHIVAMAVMKLSKDKTLVQEIVLLMTLSENLKGHGSKAKEPILSVNSKQ